VECCGDEAFVRIGNSVAALLQQLS
jgi:hypothetical protein